MAEFEVCTKHQLDLLPQNNATIISDGGFVGEGYKPDRLYQQTKVTWIVEIESSTSRKGFLGGYLKAQKYFEDEGNINGNLLFIINENKRNIMPVSEQIRQYHNWMLKHGIPVKPTYLIYNTALKKFAENQVGIFSELFLKDPAICIK